MPFTISRSMLKFMSTELVILSNHLFLHHPLLLLSTVFPRIKFFGFLCFPPMSQFFLSCGQSIGASASASVLPVNIQDSFPLAFTGLTLLSKRPTRAFSSATIRKHQFFGAPPSLWSNSHIRTWLLEKPQL